MQWKSNAKLKEWLTAKDYLELAAITSFDFPERDFGEVLAEAKRQHPNDSNEENEARAAYRILTRTVAAKPADGSDIKQNMAEFLEALGKFRQSASEFARLVQNLQDSLPKHKGDLETTVHVRADILEHNGERQLVEVRAIPGLIGGRLDRIEKTQRKWRWVAIACGIVILTLLSVLLVRSEPKPFVREILAEPGILYQIGGGPFVQVQNAGTQIKIWAAGIARLNCSTNMTCTYNAGTGAVDMTASSTAGTAWSGLTAPSANLSLSHSAWTTTFTWNAATGAGVNLLNLTDTLNNTGTGVLFRVFTASGSAAKPIQFDSNGNGVQMSTAGLLAALGTGGINATQYKGGNASGVGACGANSWASTLSDAAAPTCTQPGFTNLSGTASSAQVPHAILGAFHTDTTLGTVVRGDVITGQGVTPTWTRLAKGTASQCLQMDGTATDVVWGACGGGGGASWNAITNPTANQALSMSAFTTTHTFGAATGAGVNLWNITDTLNNTGTGKLFRVFTTSGSAAVPFQADANGVGWSVNNAGNWFPVSTATLAIPGTARGVVISEGAAAAITTTAAGTAGQLLTSNGAGADPTFQDPVISYNAVTAVTAAWTSATALNTTLSIATTNNSTVVLTFRGTSTLTAGGLIFEASDDGGTNWYALPMTRPDVYTTDNTYTVSVTSQAWDANVSGFTNFRVRLNPVIAGTGTVNLRLQATAGPSDPDTVVGQSVASNLNAQVVGNVASAATDSGNPVKTGAVFNTTQPTVTTGQRVDNQATARGAQIVATGADTFNVTVNAALPTGANVIGALSANQSVNMAQLGGTATVTGGVAGSQGVGGLAASAAAKAGNPVQIGGVFNTTQPTVTTGQMVEQQMTARGAQLVATGVDVFTATLAAETTKVIGTVRNLGNVGAVFDAAHNAAAPANVLQIGGRARTDYAGGTAFTAANLVAPDVGTEGLLHVAALPALRPSSFSASATVASAASATDIAVISGNATNTLLVTKVKVSCTQTTAGIITLNIIKRSTADTAGTSASMTMVPDDSSGTAVSSTALTYTANPTTGTAVGNVDTIKMGCMATGTATPNDIYILNRTQKPIVLRGTAQQLAVNLGGVTVTGGSFSITYEGMEITTITP